MIKTYSFTLLFWILFFTIPVHAQFLEDFEQGTKNFYAEAQEELVTGTWTFNDALIGSTASDRKNGLRAARLRDGFIRMDFDHPNGIHEVKFFAANFGSDTGGNIEVSYSDDGGQSWIVTGETGALSDQLEQFTFTVNVEGDVRLRFSRKSGNRVNIDDVLITDYVDLTQEPRVILFINNTEFAAGNTFDFGLNTGQATATLQLQNGGLEDLEISAITTEGEGFSVEADVPFTLASMEYVTLTLNYESDIPGEKTGSLAIHSNDPENNPFTVNLAAETLDASQPIPISEARKLPLGTQVTVTGWVTVADQFAGPVYLQDQTGGIAWYNGAIMRDQWLVGAIVGDSIMVSGEIGHFNNLLQIVNDTGFEVFPESNTIQEPLDITLQHLNSGDYEGWLIRITDLEFEDDGIFSGGTNYTINDPTGDGQLRVDNFTNIPGTAIPNSGSEVTGVAGRFQQTHQLLPRFVQDIIVLSGPVITSTPPFETAATPGSITFEWETMLAGHSEVCYGLTPALELGCISYTEHNTQHSVTLTDLLPATRYRVQLRSAFDADTSITSVSFASTGSPAGTTGELLVFFNKDVAHELATFREADQNIDFSEKLIEYIQMAEETAEFAFYNISGTVGGTVTNEIIDAHNRGVDVRVIVSGHTGTTNHLVTVLTNAGVKAIQSIGDEQMHNKFAIFDAHHGDPSRAWLITSSWNTTNSGTYDQYQNMVAIQDVALARAYWYEFNQMWGAESGPFTPSMAAFGPDKQVVNPSVFWIGDDQVKVELFFSPQANTESHINRTLMQAQQSIDLGLNLITRRPISNTMLSRFNQGVAVRGVIGDITAGVSEWSYLSTWADVHHFPQSEFGLLHHKYAIVDGEQTGPGSRVITGSHNWSANANFNNDENTLIIHSERVANEFFQEFAARYWQAGGEATFDVEVNVHEEPGNHSAIGSNSLYNYPNPFRTHTTLHFSLEQSTRVSLDIYDAMGKKVATLLNNELKNAGSHQLLFEADQLPAGIYFSRLVAGGTEVRTDALLLVR